ncbi:hypothetical protein F990_01573 [Acinetobacter tjernbergiae DSM 14971 = CIP 107465]|uniref:Uncharacterized protein n=1 Tax=Acinetobacter tjernbergiae DSM 14971 = CIP 107465 TaxID=1120928 RepID=V2W7D7_9GAMM|nr:hypothetical protein F990_01573 [Acinetobacter tjernbergiae DSM 14971 = CIP 107465]
MKVIELQLELKKRLLRACHQHLEFLKSDLSGKTLSSYTLLMSLSTSYILYFMMGTWRMLTWMASLLMSYGDLSVIFSS